MTRSRLARLLVWGWLIMLAPTAAAAGEQVALVVDGPLGPPAAHALERLQRALQARGFSVARRAQLHGDGSPAAVVGLAGQSSGVDRLLEAHRIDLPREAESLCLRKLPQEGGQPVLLVAGRDPRGLAYALADAARAVELGRGADPWAPVRDAVEAPFLRTRGLTVHLFNADLEKDWYFDERFWRGYFAMLAGHRYNLFSLTFADQTNYLNPPYAYLVEVPGFPNVRVKGMAEAERRRNLEMLRRISDLARDHGLEFHLGLWMQLPVPRYAGPVLVEQIPEGAAAANYCAEGLKQVLQACPAIRGVQLRMNAEAGVPEEQQAEFYRPLFRAIHDCGRPVRVDLRYKGLRPETTKAAFDAGLGVTVSTKFWCEHMGLPYHPTAEDPLYRESRYGFGSMLTYPRAYRVVYRLWTVGSQRLLLWGDPTYAARFAHSCRLGGGEGFEVFAPLTNKGYGNEPGSWRIFADRSYEHYTWEYERYWFFYLAFGRLGYNPQADPDVWRRELRHRFGKAAENIETAYRAASQIIPLLTAARLPSASEWSWWPEMDTGDRLREYMRAQPSDPAQFYAIRTWQRTPGWRCEAWDPKVPGYVEDATAGKLRGKWTPPEVSRELAQLARETIDSLGSAHKIVGESHAAEFRATDLDLSILAQLGTYHAEKTLAATQLAFFDQAGKTDRLPSALAHMRRAAAAWERVVQLSDGVYYDRLVFGTSPQHTRNSFGHHHSGHWKDRLPEVRADVADLEGLLRKHGIQEKPLKPDLSSPSTPEPPKIQHEPLTTAVPGADLTVSAQITSERPLRQVLLHYRPLNQTVDWKEVPMRRAEAGRYETVIPGKEITARWDLQYYFEALVEGGGRLWPSWEDGPPYVVVKVQRPGPTPRAR